MCVCVCVCVCSLSQKLARRAVAAQLIARSFRSWLIWIVNSFSSIRLGVNSCWMSCDPWPIYSARSDRLIVAYSCQCKCLEGNREKVSKSMRIFAFYNDFSAHPRYGAVSSKRYISKTAATICMCDPPLDSLLNGLIESKFIFAQMRNKHPRWARPTATAVPLVNNHSVIPAGIVKYIQLYSFACRVFCITRDQ